jgi:ADP-ribose pyrophosphatase YjhB (NUDIX family)
MTINTDPTAAEPAALSLLRRLLALSRTGSHFTGAQYRADTNAVFDRERYDEIGHIAAQLFALHTDAPVGELLKAWQSDDGYVTPKIDVRGAAFRDDKILLVRERSDGKWTLPGGWADVNETPAQSVEKEIVQESGFTAKAVKLAAVYDRNKRNPRPSAFHWWKFFFICEITGGAAQLSNETDGVEFFTFDTLPELSTGRTNHWQIERMYVHNRERLLPAEFD